MAPRSGRNCEVEAGRSGSKWVEVGRSGSKWVEVGRSGSKWVEVGRSGSKRVNPLDSLRHPSTHFDVACRANVTCMPRVLAMASPDRHTCGTQTTFPSV